MQSEIYSLGTPEVDPIAELREIALKSKDGVLALPKQIYQKSSFKAFMKLTKALVLLTATYVLLTQLPWYLLPIGWLLAGTTLASLLAVGYACRSDNFFNNTFVNHVVGQLCLVPLILPFESWQASYKRKKESFKLTAVDYLSRSHFWWCSSFWTLIASNIEGVWSLVQRKCRKRLLGNLIILYLFCAIFFPVMTYNLGLWGLAKYYIIPLMVYHFWASSFLKTSSLLDLLEIDQSDLVLAYYKYPTWVEFLSLELNYAFSSLNQLAGATRRKLILEEEKEEEKKEIKEIYKLQENNNNNEYINNNNNNNNINNVKKENISIVDDNINNFKKEDQQQQQQQQQIITTNINNTNEISSSLSLENHNNNYENEDEEEPIPFYNLKEAFHLIQDLNITKSIEVKFQELSFFSLIRSRTGDLIADGLATRDVIAEYLNGINWITTSFLFLTPVFAMYGLLTCEHHWQTWVLGFVHYITGGLGITAGYHRLFSHRSYKAHPIIKTLLLIWGTGSFQMSVFEWCNDHRAHHRYTDTDKDPYSIKKGFWYAHMGWLIWNREPPTSDIRDLEADPLLQFQHKYYPFLALATGFLMPTFIAGYFWGDFWGGFLIAGVLSRVVVSQATFCVNSLAHYWGELTFSDQRTPRDSIFVGLLTFGEGYHNFHHEFPYDYRNGVHLTAYDPTKWFIKGLYYLGGTHSLLEFSDEAIEKGKLQMLEKKLAQRRAALHWGPPTETLPTYTRDDVQRMCKEQGEKLIVIDSFVHDIRGFLDDHPAGSGILKPFIGKDASKVFNGEVYNHSNAARNVLETLRVAHYIEKLHEE